MKSILLSFTFLLIFPLAVFAQPAGFSFEATNLSGRIFGQVKVNDAYTQNSDWFAAFTPDGICAGAGPIISAPTDSGDVSFFSIPVYGDDPTTTDIVEGLRAGEPFTMRLYHAEIDEILAFTQDGDTVQFEGWINTNGTPIPGYNEQSQIYNFYYQELAPTSLSPFDNQCVDAADFALSGGLPEGGTYLVNGLPDSVFSPSLLGAGLHSISYAANEDTATQSIEVYALPVVSFELTVDHLCELESPVLLSTGNPTGGLYSGTGVVGDTFDPSIAGVGIFEITYTYEDSLGCAASASDTVTVYALPLVSFELPSENICINDTPLVLNTGMPQGGQYSGLGIVDNQFNPGLSGVGDFEIIYSYMDSLGCSASVADTISVHSLPEVSFSLPQSEICLHADPIMLEGGNPIGGIYSGLGIVEGEFFPILGGTGPVEIDYVYTDTLGCSASASDTIEVVACIPDWNVKPTGSNHTVVLVDSLITALDQGPLTTGDYVGFFFEDNNTSVCAGFGIWQESNLAITVYGDDPFTSEKDGFESNERLRVKVYQISSGEEFEVSANYLSNPLFTAKGRFKENGISGIDSLMNSVALQDLRIPLKKGWNLVSSYIDPEESSMADVLSPVLDQIDIVKNGIGESFIPEFQIQSLSEWNVKDGYFIRIKTDTALTISGSPVDIAFTELALRAGWNAVAYLKSQSSPAQDELAHLAGTLEIAKDGEGNVFIPSLGIDNLGDMEPTKGYQLRLLATDTLFYQARLASWSEFHQSQLSPIHFSGVKKTSNYAVLTIEKEALEGKFEYGDEFGVFDKNGNLAGSAVYEGHSLAIAVWEDDQSTTNKDGMVSSERLTLKAWTSISQKEIRLDLSSPIEFQNNGLWILNTIHVPAQNWLLPASDTKASASFIVTLEEASEVSISLFDLNGKLVKTLTNQLAPGQTVLRAGLSNLPTGIYYFKAEAGNRIREGKIFISSK